MKSDNVKIGRLGEFIAKEYFKRRGYNIVEANYRNKYVEIDLIVRGKQNVLVFVEVKTRASKQGAMPEDSLNRRKIYRLIRNAQAYLGKINHKGLARIDAVCIVLSEDGGCQRMAHYKNISQDLKN